METVPAEFPVLDALASRSRRSPSEVSAGVALVVVWAALWMWLVLGVAGPLSASIRRLAPPGGRPAVQLALRSGASR